jgi:succinate-semialdehyde dehydrogenase / glutarate-semialdehyde dehydrogenase
MTAAYGKVGLFIDGQWIYEGGAGSQPIINPATDETLGEVPLASRVQLDAALEAARKGFETWRNTAPDARASLMYKAAALVRQRAREIGEGMTMEQGKSVTEATGEVSRVAGIIDWDADEGRRAYGRVIPTDTQTLLTVRREPVGPVAAFTPWNFPAGSPMRKIAAALAAGCSIVIKASEETPGTACALVRCFEEAGLPAGVLNLVFGHPADVSEHLIASPVTRMVAFTGSIPVGKHIAGLAAAQMKPAIMELGGHAPVIVCEDADPVQAARASVAGKFVNAGQVCTSPSRFFVHESLYPRFLEEFLAATRAVKVGNGLDETVKMGPLANPRRLEAMERLVQDAVARGAKVECGGERIGAKGNFFAPTVLTGVPEDADIMHTEPFGPLAPIVTFKDLDDALARANALPYGLAAYAFTRSTATAEYITRNYQAGILSINHTGGSVHEAPSGGVKESGYGREGGQEGLDPYLVTKRVHHRLIP